MVLSLMDAVIVDENKLFVINFLDDIRNLPLLSKEWKRRLLGEEKACNIEMGNVNYYEELLKRVYWKPDQDLPTLTIQQYYELKERIEIELKADELLLIQMDTGRWGVFGVHYYHITHGWSGFDNGMCQYNLARTVAIINEKGYKEIPCDIPNVRHFIITPEGKRMRLSSRAYDYLRFKLCIFK
jgi:hypothetical protein